VITFLEVLLAAVMARFTKNCWIGLRTIIQSIKWERWRLKKSKNSKKWFLLLNPNCEIVSLHDLILIIFIRTKG
jgi:hypothetical protein